MHISSRTLWTTLIALIVTAVALVTLSAQTAERPQRPAESADKATAPGRGDGTAAMFRRLKLTEEQRKQVRAIVEEQGQGDGSTKKVGELQRELHASIFSDTPDRAKIDQLKADLTRAEAAALAARIEVDLKIAQILTAEQRAKARKVGPGRGGR